MSGSEEKNSQSPKFNIRTSKRNRKEASLSPIEDNQHLKKPSISDKMDLDQISKLLDTKLQGFLQPIIEKLEILGEVANKNIQLENRINDQDKKISALQNEIESLRLIAVEKNLIFKKITWNNNNNLKESVQLFCKNVLKLTEIIEVDDAYFINKEQSVVLVQFRSKNDIRNVLKKAYNLQGTGMRIEKDYPRSIRIKNNKLLAVRKELNKNIKNCKIRVLNGNMWLQNKKFTWDVTKGLLVDENDDGVEYLQGKFGLSVSNLVEKLKGENNDVKKGHGAQTQN